MRRWRWRVKADAPHLGRRFFYSDNFCVWKERSQGAFGSNRCSSPASQPSLRSLLWTRRIDCMGILLGPQQDIVRNSTRLMFITTETEYRAKIRLLVRQANVCGLGSRETIPVEVRTIIRTADSARRPLSLNEIEYICAICKGSEKAVIELIEKSPKMIAKASASLLHKQPGLIAQGGELFPEHRAAACWRDCEQFIRVVTYGVASNCTVITDKAGMKSLLELYMVLGVPVKALLYVLTELKNLSVNRLRRSGYERESTCAQGAFDDLICALNPKSE